MECGDEFVLYLRHAAYLCGASQLHDIHSSEECGARNADPRVGRSSAYEIMPTTIPPILVIRTAYVNSLVPEELSCELLISNLTLWLDRAPHLTTNQNPSRPSKTREYHTLPVKFTLRSRPSLRMWDIACCIVNGL